MLSDAILEISKKGVGMDRHRRQGAARAGIFTDANLRRTLAKKAEFQRDHGCAA